MSKRKTKLDEFHWHEALHTADLILQLFDREISEHPVVRATPKLAAKAGKIETAMCDLYQMIGKADPRLKMLKLEHAKQ